MLESITRKIIAKPKLIIIISLLLMIPSAVGFIFTGVNYNLLSYLPEKLDSVQGEVVLDETFGCASMSFLIVEGMKTDDIDALKDNILAIDCVKAVGGVDDILGSGFPASMLPDEISDVLYSKDSSATIILIQFSTGSADSKTLNAIEEINSLTGKQCFLSGLSAILSDTKTLVERQAPLYIICAIASALAMLTLLSESWLIPPIVLYTICSAVVYNMGTNIVFGEISYLTECIAVVLQLAVTMDYSVFLIERFNEELDRGLDKNEAIVEATKKSISSLLGSSLTTVFGFAALCFMSLTIGFDIGIVMIKGVVFGMLSVILILPALLVQFNEPLHKYTHRFFRPSFGKMNVLLIKRKPVFVVLFVVLLIPAYLMQTNVSEYYSLDEMLGNSRPSIVALNKLKEDFGMASVDFAIVDHSLTDSQMHDLIEKAEDVEGVKTVIAYNKYVGPALPESMIPESILSIVKNDGKQMMILISEYTAGHEDSNTQIDELTAILKSYDPESYLTGEGPLTKDLVEIADSDFKVTTIISIAAVLAIIALCLQSLTLPFILVAAVELAIMINQGISLITGSSIPFIAPAIVGCIQLGATVDYAILLTNRYRQELKNGRNRKQAMLYAANASDVSIFKSMCVFFAATICVYFISDVDIVQDLCLLLARGSLISGAIVMLLLSPILVTFESLIGISTVGWPAALQRRSILMNNQTASEQEATESYIEPDEPTEAPDTRQTVYQYKQEPEYEFIPGPVDFEALQQEDSGNYSFSVETQVVSLDDSIADRQKQYDLDVEAINRDIQTVPLPDRETIVYSLEAEKNGLDATVFDVNAESLNQNPTKEVTDK